MRPNPLRRCGAPPSDPTSPLNSSRRAVHLAGGAAGPGLGTTAVHPCPPSRPGRRAECTGHPTRQASVGAQTLRPSRFESCRSKKLRFTNRFVLVLPPFFYCSLFTALFSRIMKMLQVIQRHIMGLDHLYEFTILIHLISFIDASVRYFQLSP